MPALPEGHYGYTVYFIHGYRIDGVVCALTKDDAVAAVKKYHGGVDGPVRLRNPRAITSKQLLGMERGHFIDATKQPKEDK